MSIVVHAFIRYFTVLLFPNILNSNVSNQVQFKIMCGLKLKSCFGEHLMINVCATSSVDMAKE